VRVVDHGDFPTPSDARDIVDVLRKARVARDGGAVLRLVDERVADSTTVACWVADLWQ